MRFYVVQDAKTEHIIDAFLSPEAAMSRLPSADWARNEHNFWRSDALKLTIRCFEVKG